MIADDLLLTQKGGEIRSTLINVNDHSISESLLIDPVLFVESNKYAKRSLHLGWCKPIIKRRFLIDNELRYDDSLKVMEDYWFYLQCLLSNAKFVLIPRAYYYLYSRQGSLGRANSSRVLKDNIRKTQKLLSLPTVKSNSNLVSALLSNKKIYQEHFDYQSVMEFVRSKKWALIFFKIFQYPRFLKVFIVRVIFGFNSIK